MQLRGNVKMIRKLGVLFVILTISFSSILSNLYVSAKDISERLDSFKADVEESHVVNGVPYISQETNFYCRFASITMLIKYYVEDVTLKEILYNSGIGYSVLYFRPIKLKPLPGVGVCQLGDYTSKFLAPLYGLSHEIWRANPVKDGWNQYWPKLKEKIKQDLPVLTDVDALSLPKYKEYFNPPNGTVSGHSIVIVGFNESAGLIYYNDPGLVLLGEDEENCSYIPLPIDEFQVALKKNDLPTFKYMIETFKKISNPMSKEDAFNLAHERNHQRLEGKYSDLLLKIIPLTDYGIKAVKSMKKDLGIGLRHRFATLMLMKYYKIINYTIPADYGSWKGKLRSSVKYNYISIEKQNISQYLLENQHLSPIFAYEGELLAQEANHWDNMSILVQEFFIAANNGPIKSRILLKPIINEMSEELDRIIYIEEEIIYNGDL